MREGKITQAVFDRAVRRVPGSGAVYGRDASDAGVSVTIGPVTLPERQDVSQHDFLPRQTAGKAAAPERQADELPDAIARHASVQPDTLGRQNTVQPANPDPTVEMRIAEAVNNTAICLAERRLDPAAVSIEAGILLPETAEEADLKAIETEVTRVCREQKLYFAGGHTEVSSAVLRPVLSVSAYPLETARNLDAAPAASIADSTQAGAKTALSAAGSKSDASPAGRDLVMCGYAGTAGTQILLRTYRKELEGHFTRRYLSDAERAVQAVFLAPVLRALLSPSAAVSVGNVLTDSGSAAHNSEANDTLHVSGAGGMAHGSGCSGDIRLKDISRGGVFAALWEAGEYWRVGMDLDVHRIPILQATVEICEFLGLNPYQLYGQGAFLLACSDGKEAALKLRRAGFPASVLGTLTSGEGRYLRSGDRVRCLDKPQTDALTEVPMAR